jgi:tRNA A-37 threonylcarbamoyl transferase component Bud32
MTPDPVHDESYADLLAACDEAIGAGEALPRLPGGLARVVDCLYRLNRRTVHQAVVREVGRFQVRRELGRGGFGVVYLAFDPRLGRDVALKVPRPDVLASDELRERFHREARAAAGLDHPNVVPVYEAGEAGPACYIASAYCPGPTLREWLRGRADPVPVADAASLVAALADGAGHAHARGIVHRDLKPANILLAGARGKGQGASEDPTASSFLAPCPLPLAPKITDFGLAKLTDAGEASTCAGVVLGTPSYMAPEQAEGRRGVGPAADVYALGVILYECLTGRPPFVGETDLDTLRQAGSQDPVPPSRLRVRLPRDLETVCLKCLEKDPRRRYPTATELAADLRRFLAGEPVTARRVGMAGRLWKRARRRPVVAGLLAALVALTVGGTAAVTVLWRRAEVALAGEAAQRGKTEAELADKLIALARIEWETDHVERAAEYLRDCPEVHRDRDWRYLDRMCRLQVASFPAAGRTVRVAYSPDGRLVAAAGEKRLTVWDVEARAEVFGSELGLIPFMTLGFTPDSRRLILLHPVPPVAPPPPKPGEPPSPAKPAPWRMLSWDTATGKPTPDSPIDWTYPPRTTWTNSPAGFSACAEGPLVRVTNLVTGEGAEFAHGHKVVHRLEFNAGGRHLLTTGPGEPVKVWDAATGRPAATVTSYQPLASVQRYRETLSPDARRLIWRTGGMNDGRVSFTLWDLERDREAVRIMVPQGSVTRTRFSPDGRHFAFIDGRAIVIVDLTTRREVLTLRGHTNTIIDMAFGSDGRRLASVGWDQTLRVWDVSPLEE